ncbi:uncharacterized protein BO95DRAFT_195312 [Aspergillus brunneoviolaceus CBS 621.78]|uniref:Uncharacterized protein n=1 Tax=Aspergillus brunneoviolaceus CBS 621.78 TaxID=1450534 RepID=A0ACD1GMA2_9EURO|nr:hypothetical protein BO95DRAFT_195312 [Aspergillus brunneoviolaceus CBS 621.78]RAH50239.1 hypothetical protein BO95DRAFT_195312 [Aspergillus brunneoviolaceus CBS 621.78]
MSELSFHHKKTPITFFDPHFWIKHLFLERQLKTLLSSCHVLICISSTRGPSTEKRRENGRCPRQGCVDGGAGMTSTPAPSQACEGRELKHHNPEELNRDTNSTHPQTRQCPIARRHRCSRRHQVLRGNISIPKFRWPGRSEDQSRYNSPLRGV